MSVLDCLGYANVALGAKQIWLIHNRRTATDYRSGKKFPNPNGERLKRVSLLLGKSAVSQSA
jgi:hypothetical protein